MSKPKSQLNPKVKEMFSGTEVGALLENIDDKLGIIIEGQELLRGRVGKLETKVAVLTDSVGDVKVEVTEIKDRLDRKADRVVVQQLDRRVAALESK